MLTNIKIQNFKSIRDLEFSAKRVNVFIGEPNTGKSNILDALAVFSEGLYQDSGTTLQEVLRYKTVSELFFDRELSEEIKISANGLEWQLKYQSSYFQGWIFLSGQEGISFTMAGASQLGGMAKQPQTQVRYYRFNPQSTIQQGQVGVLLPPYGANLGALLVTNKRLRSMVSDLFLQRDFRLAIEADKNEFGMAKFVNDQFYTFSYPTISETYRRIIFFMAMMETNESSVLILDEPETNTFPFYTKYLAERIALNNGNQFFITTHNPYLLSSLVEKTPKNDLGVFVTTMAKYQTKLKPVSEKNLSELLSLDADAFFNLDRLVHE